MTIRFDAAGLRRVDLNLLPVFAALMHHRSVTKAGEALFLSQPAASAALARLREALRDELFVRNGRVLEPTARAEALMAELGPALATVGRALVGATTFDPAADERTFRIGWSEDVGILAMPLLEALRREAPACRLVIRQANYATVGGMLDSGEVGTAFGFMTDDLPATTRQRVLRRGGFRVLRDAGTPAVDLDAYCARPHVLVTVRGSLTGFADEALARLGRARRVVLGVPDYGLLRRLLLGTDLLCTVSDMLAEALVAIGGLAADPAPVECPESTIRMAWRATLDHDPAETWLRGRIAAALTRTDPAGPR